MAGFVINNVDYDQFGGGVFPAVEEFRTQLPVAATLWRWIPGPDRPDYALAELKQPIKYHPTDAFNWTRPRADFIGHDDAGRFVAIYLVAIASLMEGTQIHRGMKGFPVRLAYAIDNTVGRDEQLDFAKCDCISYAVISALPDEPEPPAAGG